jgi:hypothetical protein
MVLGARCCLALHLGVESLLQTADCEWLLCCGAGLPPARTQARQTSRVQQQEPPLVFYRNKNVLPTRRGNVLTGAMLDRATRGAKYECVFREEI